MGFKSELAPKGLQFNPSDFVISDKYATILTVVSYPRFIGPGYLSNLTNMSGVKLVIFAKYPGPINLGYDITVITVAYLSLIIKSALLNCNPFGANSLLMFIKASPFQTQYSFPHLKSFLK